MGSGFTKQWPKIKHVFQSRRLKRYTEQATKCLVSEKLDGSNIAVTSREVVASRRKVLLDKPTEEELRKYKFSGVTMAKVVGMFEKLKLLEIQLRNIVAEVDEVLVYGELIQEGTAASKMDRFNYRSRGLEAGEVVIFGAGLSLKGDLKSGELEVVLERLRARGLLVIGGSQNEDVETNNSDESGPRKIAVLMNDTLKDILQASGFENLVEQTQVKFCEISKFYLEKQLNGDVEGVVIVAGEEILKWKSTCESQEYYLTEIEETKDKVDKATFEAFKVVAEESVRLHSKKNKGKTSVEKLLEAAFDSALTKINTIKEHIENGGSPETYKEELMKEMLNDSNNDGGFKKLLPGFVEAKVNKT